MVMRCMELGYTGVAFNFAINGVMSDRDRCSILTLSPSSISSLFSISPSFSSSVKFRRDLLGVSASSPFRQYTRLTIRIETPSQALSVNRGNPVLKTYDIIAVRPVNQIAFEQSCEKLEVDIIAIDFTDKLPFRMKLPLITAAIKRGVHFEISYSNFLGDPQVRRQLISNAKMLVGWTRGRNIILSSGGSSPAELRGPYDAANLLSLLGVSQERAKEAITTTCSKLVRSSLRRRNFYKEAIRVEHAPSEEQFSEEWKMWDDLSSGDADLTLDDLSKSFSDLTQSKPFSKAIDFSCIIDKNAEKPCGVVGTSVGLPELDTAQSSDIIIPENAALGKVNGLPEKQRGEHFNALGLMGKEKAKHLSSQRSVMFPLRKMLRPASFKKAKRSKRR